MTVAAATPPGEGAQMMTLASSGVGLFAILGPVLGGVAAAWWGWRAALLVVAVYGALALAFLGGTLGCRRWIRARGPADAVARGAGFTLAGAADMVALGLAPTAPLTIAFWRVLTAALAWTGVRRHGSA